MKPSHLIRVPEFPDAYWLRLPHYSRDERDRRMQCRKTFDLNTLPEKAVINVTGDAKYTLYVNGQFVHFGPARGFQTHWPYDQIDIAPYLRCGKNVIASQVYKFGMGMTMYVYGYDNGFLLSGRIGDVDLSTGASWLVRHAPGYIPAVFRSSGQYGFQEFFDCRDAQDNWFAVDYDEDGSWFEEKSSSHLRDAGCAPWHTFEKRGVPLLTGDVVSAARVVAYSDTPTADGLEKEQNIFINYADSNFIWQPDGSAGSRIDFSSAEKSAFIIDIGEEMPGRLIFDIDGAADGDMLGFVAFEALKSDGVTPDFADILPEKQLVFGGRLTLSKKKYTHELSLPWGVRYVAMWKNQGSFSVKLAARRLFADLDVQGSFTASDPLMQSIWDMCLRTQRCCIVDSYVDCPGRENSQWWGDALVQAQNTFRLSDEPSFLARGLRQIGEVFTPEGLTYAIAPTCSTLCILPDYSALYPVTVYAHYRQTGSLVMYETMRHAIENITGYFRKEISASDTGLAGFDPRYWLFLDWCDGLYKKGTPLLLNLIWLWGLKCIEKLAALADDQKMQVQAGIDADNLLAAIEKNLYDRENGWLLDGLDNDGNVIDTHCPHAAALAIILDIFPENHRKWVDEILLPLVKGDRSSPLQPSTYFIYFIFEALKIKGYGKEVIECISRWWGEFVEADCSTTPELFLDRARKGHTSFCHAWSAHPLVHYQEILLGVTQVEAGWKRVKIDPLLIPGLNVSGAVPTPFGKITVSVVWNGENPAVDCRVPEGIVAYSEYLPGS